MESFAGDNEENTENGGDRKKSKIKSLKARLFRKSKKTVAEDCAKLSQSASDITVGKALGSDECLASSQGTMGTRAFSHDSIFLDDQVLTSADPARVSSQDNVHSKIKALQTKLQLQKMHFGPPPAFLPNRNPEEAGSQTEDFSFHTSEERSGDEALTEATSQPVSPLTSSIPRPGLSRSLPPTPSVPFSLSAPNNSSISIIETPVDFSTPAEFVAPLDTSAARHRMSIKPRNQRASSKRKPSSVVLSGSPSHDHNTSDLLEVVKEKEQHRFAEETEVEKTETGKEESTLEEVSPFTPEPPTISPSQNVPLLDQDLPETVDSPALLTKLPRHLDTVLSGRPHSWYTELEFSKKDTLESQVFSQSKKNIFTASVPEECPDKVSIIHGEEEDAKEKKGSCPESGSVQLFKNLDEERRRSSSFTGAPEQQEAKRSKTSWGSEHKVSKGKEEFQVPLLKGSPFTSEIFKKEQESTSGPPILWDRKNSLRKRESVSPARTVLSKTSLAEGKQMDSCQEQQEEPQKDKEEEEQKTAFGIKLRPTSQSMKLRSDSASNRQSKTLLPDAQEEPTKKEDTNDSSHRIYEKQPASISCEIKTADPAHFVTSIPVKASPTNTPPCTMPVECQATASYLKEVETAQRELQRTPQTTSSDVSWMSLALQKTRSLQQLFTNRFQRDSTVVEGTARQQIQSQPKGRTETMAVSQNLAQQSASQTQAPNQPLEESVQGSIQEQSVKPLSAPVQKKMALITQFESFASKESQTSKQMTDGQALPDKDKSDIQSTVPTNPWTLQSPLRSVSQTAPSSPFSRGNTSSTLAQSYLSSSQQSQQPSWINQSLKSSISETVQSSAEVPASESPIEGQEKEAPVLKEGPILVSRRVLWTGSVTERAAFLEKRAEWTAPTLPKEAELKKAQTEMQTSVQTDTSTKHDSTSKVTEITQRIKSTESSPTRLLEKPLEEKWLRRNVELPSSPLSLRTHSSPVQSVSDGSQPSWMELAKRKSMAWSDKTMD